MDFGAFEIGGLSVLVLVLGWVEAAKKLGVRGRWSQVLALGLGFLLVGLSVAIQRGLIVEAMVVWIEVVVLGLGGALAAMGVFDLVKRSFL